MKSWLATIDSRTFAKWALTACLLSVLAMLGMIVAVPDIDRHPIVFAFSMNWVIAGFVGLLTQHWLLRMDPWRFRFASWEREGRVYRYLGVEPFRWLLRRTPLGWLNPAVRMSVRKAELENLLRQLNFAEGAHWIGGAITLCLAVGYSIAGHVKVGVAFAVVTLLCNAYPIITQRWNRGRVARVAQRVALESKRRQDARSTAPSY